MALEWSNSAANIKLLYTTACVVKDGHPVYVSFCPPSFVSFPEFAAYQDDAVVYLIVEDGLSGQIVHSAF